MQITYDTKADAIYIKFYDGDFVANKEVEEGIILDFGQGNILLGIEILEASMRFRPEDLAKVEIQMPLNLAALKGGRKKMRCWILQCNPSTYRIFKYWEEHPDDPDTWSVGRYEKEVKIGDTVFIWVASGGGICERGIYAVGEVISPPMKDRKCHSYEPPYFIDKAEEQRLSKLPRLEQRYKELFPNKPLLAKHMRNHSILKDLLILRMPQSGIYKLTEEQCETIKKLVGK